MSQAVAPTRASTGAQRSRFILLSHIVALMLFLLSRASIQKPANVLVMGHGPGMGTVKIGMFWLDSVSCMRVPRVATPFFEAIL